MKESNDLWELVQTLSKSEKRYIQIEFKPNSLQAKLFSAIAKQDEYDQDALYKKFPGEDPSHIRTMQQYLHKTILKYLRSFHSASSIDIMLNEYLTEIEILFNKGLIRQCLKILIKAKKLALEYECYEYLDRLITFEERIHIASQDFSKTNTYFQEYKADCRLIISKLANIGATRELFHKVFSITKNIGFSRNADDRAKLKDTIEHHPLLRSPEAGHSLRAKMNYYLTKIFYSHAINEFAECYKYSKEYAALIRSQASEWMPSEYAIAMVPPLQNLILSQAHLKLHKELEETLKEFRSLAVNVFTVQNRVFTVSYSIEMDMYISTGQFHKIKDMITGINEGLHTYKRLVDVETFRAICYNTGSMYFGIGEYNTSIHWFNKILNDAPGEKREDIFCFTQILKLIALFEMQDEDYMESVLRATYRYLYKRQRLYKFETLVLKFIQRQLSLRKLPDMKVEFKELHETMKKLFEEPHEKIVLEYFDFLSWLESKLENRPFADIVQEKTKARLVLK
jgi:hypothetical protein